MSRFNLDNAAELARQSYRLRVNDSEGERAIARAASPLLGKEERLLEVLRDAETTFDEWQEGLGQARRQTQKLLGSYPQDCKRLIKHLENVRTCWGNMQAYGGQYALACNAVSFETTAEANDFIQNFDDLLQKMLAGAQTGSQQKKVSYRGRPAAHVALKEFTKVVRSFWVEAVPEKFGYDDGTLDQEDGRLEPTSAAARLIMGAARILDSQYTLGNVREVIEAANNDPQPF
jgi:hypothetical protein